MVDYADGESSSGLEGDNQVASNVGLLALDLPSGRACSKSIEGNIASSSHSQVRSYFVGMGFLPTLVDKAIEENGEDNADLLLETLIAYSDNQKTSPGSPDSLDEVLGDCRNGGSDCRNGGSSPDFAIDRPEVKAIKKSPESSDSLDEMLDNCENGSTFGDFATNGFELQVIKKSSPASSDSLDELFGDYIDGTSSSKLAIDGPQVKEELDSAAGFCGDKRASLLMMNFSEQEVDFAIQRLGEDAPVDELVDLIVAAQIAQSSGNDVPDLTRSDDRKDQENGTESLFHPVEKTLSLLEMGFTEDEVSAAIEKYGAEVPVGELADSIFAYRMADTCFEDHKYTVPLRVSESHANGWAEEHSKRRSFDDMKVKTEPSSSYSFLNDDLDFKETVKGKKPKHEYEDYEDYSNAFHETSMPEARTFEPKSSMPSYKRINQFSEDLSDRMKIPQQFSSTTGRSIDAKVAKPPYFFYGNVLDVSYDTWSKLSQFIYAVPPEFVNTQFFSALNRKEGYIHNLPTEVRSYILPRCPMSIEDVFPHIKKWRPSWDTRKQLSCISSDIKGTSQICERLGRMLFDSRGMLSTEQQMDLLHHCKTWNLMWMGQHKLSPIEPEQLESILGYSVQHTEIVRNLEERLRLLEHCFQTDTVGYHLSALKQIFPNGLTVLSLYSGIGGAEVALHRLGIRLKNVVSVELCETNRRILRNWWQNTGQKGELEQIEDIGRLTSKKLKSLANDFGGFDLVICQNPFTGSSKNSCEGQNPAEFNFTLFFEFVRVLQCVRSGLGNR